MSMSPMTGFYARDDFIKLNHTANGPRNLPQPDARKKARKTAKAARKRNRDAYRG